jgi:hypothetical protein
MSNMKIVSMVDYAVKAEAAERDLDIRALIEAIDAQTAELEAYIEQTMTQILARLKVLEEGAHP